MVPTDKILKQLGKAVLKHRMAGDSGLFLEIQAEDIYSCAEALFGVFGMRLITITASDQRAGIELYYHFADDAAGAVISLKTVLKDKKRPQIASIAPVTKAAEWIEREIHELFGVNFAGHPGLKHLLLRDDWPENDFPMRKDNER